eukprot:TRINITY_DN427_c0_g1_i1.p3 TRINITY_DN427_c0_g1~~TRINITY_DN427_c0_g1_i1.p3  ORF type:complete len:103 (-),score=27.09 TRINITY_DN427_c0_g1_i1:211-519(-)
MISKDDEMGDASVDLQPLCMAAHAKKDEPDSETESFEVSRLVANEENSFVSDSLIRVVKGQTVQDISFKLKNVESGELEIQLKWIDLYPKRNPSHISQNQGQ